MEAATVRPSMQVVVPTAIQRTSDPGIPPPLSQPPQSALSYQQRIPSGASPIHRPVDTPQSYTKNGIAAPVSQQPLSRVATSPLSSPRPGGAVNHTAYPRFSDVNATSLRYVHGSQYGVAQVQQFRDSPFARISQLPTAIQEYHRPSSQSIVSSNNNISIVPTGSMSAIETIAQGHSSTRQRMSLISTSQQSSEYMLNTRSNSQALPDPAGQPFKKMRFGEANHAPGQQLKVDTRAHRSATTEAYHPQVEAISPTLPNDIIEERRTTKDDLLMQINKVDNEITKAENAKIILKNKEKMLEEVSSKPVKEPEPSEVPTKHRSLAQKIYADNRKRALEDHCVLMQISPQNVLPLYNQPSDVDILQEIIKRHQAIKCRLMIHLRRVKSERATRNSALVDKYTHLSHEWLKRVEKVESSAKRKAKDSKNREFFEKVFTELRKQREDKERFNRVGSRIKSEADLEEIMDGLQEQAMEDKKMRSYAVIPPPIYDTNQRRCAYSSENGFLEDMVSEYKESQNINVWTAGEKEIFKEKFLQHPKNFGVIAASLDRKSAQDCVRYYYLSKKTENYKQLLRKSRQRTRSSRNPQRAHQVQTHCIVDSLTTGVTTRLQREQQQKSGGRDRIVQVTTVEMAIEPTAICETVTGTIVSTLASAAGTEESPTGIVNNVCSSESTASILKITNLEINSGKSTSMSSGTSMVTTSLESDASIGRNATSASETSSEGYVAQLTNGIITPLSAGIPQEPLNIPIILIDKTNDPESQPISSEATFSASGSEKTIQTSVVNNCKEGVSTSCTEVLTSGLEIIVDGLTSTKGNVNSQSETKNVSIFNGMKNELILKKAVENSDDCITFCDDKEIKTKGKHSENSFRGDNLRLSSIPQPNSEDNVSACGLNKTRKDSNTLGEETKLIVNTARKLGLNTMDNKDKCHPCFVCKMESCPRTRPLKKGRGQQYGISDETIITGARVCNSCQCKSVRNRYPNCPLSTCPNSKDRAKRLHNIPSRLYELAPEIREPILQEFQIPSNASRCCSACLMRIRRKLDPHSHLTDDEHRTMLTDGDESDMSTSSCDERDAASSDTASAESPNNPPRPMNSQSTEIINSDPNAVAPIRKVNSFKDERLVPPLSQAPRKQKTIEEYDSSATETADEENENSPANRQSPKSTLLVNSAAVSLLPPDSLQNGPHIDATSEQQTNVQEIMYNLIERSVKTVMPMKPSSLSIAKQSSNESRDVAFVREYRNNVGSISVPTSSITSSFHAGTQIAQQIGQIRQIHSQPLSNESVAAESLATLSVVNSQTHSTQQIISHQHGNAATITPVKTTTPHSITASQQLHTQSGLIGHLPSKDDVNYSNRNEPEPQTLDLSIKKNSIRDNMSVNAPVTNAKVQPQPSSSAIAVYRNESPNITFHHQVEINRPTKSPSVYTSQVPSSLSQSVVRVQSNPPTQITLGIPNQQQAKQKGTSKLSPKMHQNMPCASQMIGPGPKGSITHGTPVNTQQQQIFIQTSAALSPRYEGIPRQTPPGLAEGNKSGSITQGTPVHHIQEKQRGYFDLKNNRQSPAQQGPPFTSAQPHLSSQTVQQSSLQVQSFMSAPPYTRQSYAMEQAQQLSSRQIVMHDYITSQQMQGPHCRQGRSDKESSITMAYYEKERTRPEYMSRTSPAEHLNSTSSPHRTPPPQRQGVIQRHNTSGSKPASPSPNRHPVMPHYPSAGHEAFSSFVEVAVQQPQLPVPQKDEKRAILMPLTEHQGSSPHYDIRYQMTPEQQLQIHHQQQHFRQQATHAAVDMQRRLQAQQERDLRERQERENAERQNQERMQMERERIDREIERDRERIRMVEEQEREERRREISRTIPTSGMYMRNKLPTNVNRIPERERDVNQSTRPPMEVTPATIIDAIIQNSIKGTSEPLSRREVTGRPQQFYANREQQHSITISGSENNVKPSSPNVINIELDVDRSRKKEIGTITIGELTDSIIAKDYGPSAVLSRSSAYMIPSMQDTIPTPDQWKYRRLQQKDNEQGAAVNVTAVANVSAERNKSSQLKSGAPDERQIIRMAQTSSPRNKFNVLSQGNYYSNVHGASSPAASVSSVDRRIGVSATTHQFALDCYVKNRIVEAMRTEDDRRSDEVLMHGHHDPTDVHRQGSVYGKEIDVRSNSGCGISSKSNLVNYDVDRRSIGNNTNSTAISQPGNDSSHSSMPYSPSQPHPATTFASTTCAYPYNILNVSGPPLSSSKQIESGISQPPQQTIAEPKPLLVPHYEPLSDED